MVIVVINEPDMEGAKNYPTLRDHSDQQKRRCVWQKRRSKSIYIIQATKNHYWSAIVPRQPCDEHTYQFPLFTSSRFTVSFFQPISPIPYFAGHLHPKFQIPAGITVERAQ